MMTTSQLQFDATALSCLVCPACRGDLHFSNQSLTCTACSRIYPIFDGIPVLITERAETRPAHGA
jgi:uncharacterized protein YbaR (Trm112 family)